MPPRGGESRREQAPQAHPAHERAEQDADRNSGPADDELEQLEPDDFVDERGGGAGDEQQQNDEALEGGWSNVVMRYFLIAGFT
ncbi:MAG: hypothetical protein HY048_00625 [Acidobacteria bacterium]|nr:hypothetical protein [Acidobacteriota bacterium]